MPGRLWLGEAGDETLLDEYGRSLDEREVDIKREGRVADGTLVCDRIAVKKQFQITWQKMPEDTMEILLVLYRAGEDLSLKVERSTGAIDTYTVRFQPFGRRRFLVRDGYALWDGQPVILDEV